MFESGDAGESRFERVAGLMHAYLLAWRNRGYDLEANLDLIKLDLPDLIDLDPEDATFFYENYVDDKVGMPSAAFIHLLSDMINSHADGGADAFTEAYETAMGQIIDRSNAQISHYVLLDYLLHMMFLVGMTELGSRFGAQEFDAQDLTSKEITTMDQDSIFDKVKRHGAESLTDEEKTFLRRFVGESFIITLDSVMSAVKKMESK